MNSRGTAERTWLCWRIESQRSAMKAYESPRIELNDASVQFRAGDRLILNQVPASRLQIHNTFARSVRETSECL